MELKKKLRLFTSKGIRKSFSDGNIKLFSRTSSTDTDRPATGSILSRVLHSTDIVLPATGRILSRVLHSTYIDQLTTGRILSRVLQILINQLQVEYYL